MNLLHQLICSFYSHLFTSMTQSFPCPHCLFQFSSQQRNLLPSPHPESTPISSGTLMIQALPDNIYYFSNEVIVNACRSGKKELICTNGEGAESHGEPVKVTLIAPDITLQHLPIIKARDIHFHSGVSRPPILAAEYNHTSASVPPATASSGTEGSSEMKGGFGKVMRAEWRGQAVAVKEPLEEITPRNMSAFIAEMTVMSVVSAHLNIVRFFGACLHPKLWLVMEFVLPILPPHLGSVLGVDTINKPDLSSLLELCVNKGNNTLSVLDQVLPMVMRKQILVDVARALNYLHQQIPPILHGDFHTGNIFISSLDESGTGPWAKVADFGLSQTLYSGTSLSVQTTFSNINVYAPEVLATSKCGIKSDVWSFAMVCYVLVDPLTSPFAELEHNPEYAHIVPSSSSTTTTVAVKLRHIQVAQALASGAILPSLPKRNARLSSSSGGPASMIPQWAKDIVNSCWVADPAQRPTMEEIIGILQQKL
ncbi:serine/threonine-protein kinase CTR1 [Pelomyxa schiedti]|nr:serine/threonine-protein kinase CTR1 [Pelomyxa schiedti]